WGRDPMVYHPHVHFVVPGGGVNETEGCWQATAENFFMHHGTACRVYKEKFKTRLEELELLDQVDPKVWRKKWNVDIKPVGNGQAVLKYLAPYVYRVAISDNRIVSCTEDSVTYRYTPSGTKQCKRRTVSGLDFTVGFLQHVLPRGFQKVRYYGWMSPNHRIRIEEVRWMVWLFLGWTFTLAMLARKKSHSPPASRCTDCGGPLSVIKITDRNHRVIYSRGPPLEKAS
ncbi:IS91 family transposase, partial [Novipirellula caenicola]